MSDEIGFFVPAGSSGGGGSEPATPTAPTNFYALGSEVGVPVGAPLTATSGIPAADATELFTLIHPDTGDEAVVEVQVFRRRRWTATIQPNPGAGVTYLFDECEFDVEGEAFVVDLQEDNAKTPFNVMTPSAIFRRCSFDGNSSSSRCLNAGFVWLIDCDLRNSEDAWGACYYSVALRCNFMPTTDSLGDPHQDGIQFAGLGDTTIYQCAVSAGKDPGANSAIRLGTDFSAISNVQILYCLLDDGGYTLQVRGDPGDRGVTGVTVRGCRWFDNAAFGPVDFEQVTGTTWADNRFVAGAAIPAP